MPESTITYDSEGKNAVLAAQTNHIYEQHNKQEGGYLNLSKLNLSKLNFLKKFVMKATIAKYLRALGK